jgi:putative addiction module killer protein
MFTVRQTPEFAKWFRALRDARAFARIDARIARAAEGNFGDMKPAGGGGVSEMRIDYGPGYRVYFIRRGNELIILLCGGDKASQDRDIKRAQKIARELED